MYSAQNWGNAWRTSTFLSVVKPHTNKLYILRHCTNIIYSCFPTLANNIVLYVASLGKTTQNTFIYLFTGSVAKTCLNDAGFQMYYLFGL